MIGVEKGVQELVVMFDDSSDIIRQQPVKAHVPKSQFGLAPAKLLLPKLASKGYTVTTKGGIDYSFNGDSVKKIKRFGELLRERADVAGISWDTVEVHA